MKRSLRKIAGIVSLGTLLSKSGGLIRQLVVAGAFGVGAAYDAYNYAYVIPGFFLILIGGINGPLHNSIVTVLSRSSKKEKAYILSSINTLISLLLIIISIILFIAADPIIKVIGPGLSLETHEIATKQLEIMSPILLFSGLIGISFGALNATNEFFLPSISPIISSIVLIIFSGSFWIYYGPTKDSVELSLRGGIILAQATLLGALLQFLLQIPSLIRKGLIKLKLSWDWSHPGVKEVWRILTPAILSSGMLQVNVVTDLFFASNIIGAASGLGYANFLIQAPLGLISNALLIPFLPTFAKLTKVEDKPELIKKISQSIMLSSVSMIGLGSLFISVGTSIVSLIYGRGAFDSQAIDLVGSLLVAYGIGMPAYLGRDLLVRVFYAIGDGKTPFSFSFAGIILNIFLDWFLIGAPSPWGHQLSIDFGVQGIVLATVGVNIFTCIGLLLKLNQKLNDIPLKKLSINILKLIICGLFSGLIAWAINSISIFSSIYIFELVKLTLAMLCGLIIFVRSGIVLHIKEVNELMILFEKKINHP